MNNTPKPIDEEIEDAAKYYPSEGSFKDGANFGMKLGRREVLKELIGELDKMFEKSHFTIEDETIKKVFYVCEKKLTELEK